MPDSPATIGVISDIHSNIVALHAVIRDMPAVDAVVCAGDVVGYNPWPSKCVDYVRTNDIPTVSGNHDRAAVTGQYGWFNEMGRAGIAYARDHLTDEQLNWLGQLPDAVTLYDGRLKVVHDHPERRNHYTYPAEFDPDLLDGESVLVLGHTHIQHAEVYDEGIVVNPGSVGQPRDGNPFAAYAVVDLDALSVELYRTQYAVTKVQHEIRACGLPEESAARLADGR